MGQLIEGQWHTHDRVTIDSRGVTKLKPSSFRGAVTADGTPGPDGRIFAAEAGRYHLVVSYGCPFAHRALLAHALCGLKHVVGLTVVEPVMGEEGWAFLQHAPQTTSGAQSDPILHRSFLREWYTQADASFTGRVTVPVLWDRNTGTIVNNESADLMRMFAEGFGKYATPSSFTVPPSMAGRVEAMNEWVQTRVTQLVYRCGFATSQTAYDAAFQALFAALDELNTRLGSSHFLLGSDLTESDWRLFVTLIRFDAVYVPLFRCNARRIVDYVHLCGYMQRLYAIAGVRETVHVDHIKRHYFLSHPKLNPSSIVPGGPLELFAKAEVSP